MGWLPSRRETRVPANREIRAPRAATQATAWYNREHPMPAEWDAETAFRYAYIANSIVYRCVQIIANDIASLPLRIGPDSDKPQNFRDNHPLAKLLSPPPNGPNPTFSSSTLIAHAVASYIVAGRFGWELELGKGRNGSKEPVFIWPLSTPHLKPVPTQSGAAWFREFWYEITGSSYKKVLTPDQIHYQWRPSQIDFRQPESVIQAARLDISVAVMQDRYDYAFLKNDARPAALIVHEAFEEEGLKEAFRGQFLADHMGPDNAGKVAWAEKSGFSDSPADKSIHVEMLGLSQRDAEFIKRYETKIRNICASIGVPLSKLDASGRTFNNAEAEERTYWQDTIRPLANTFAGNLSVDLLPRFPGSDSLACWFDFSGIEALRPHVEPVTQPTDVIQLKKAGIITLNEARSDYGFAPVDDEDANELIEEETPPNPFGGFGGAPGNPPNDEEKEAARIAYGYRNGANRYSGTTTNSGIGLTRRTIREMRRAATIRTTHSTVDSLETLVAKGFRRLFEAQEQATIARLEGRRGKTLLNQLPDAVELIAERRAMEKANADQATGGDTADSSLSAAGNGKVVNRVEERIRREKAHQSAGTITYPISTRQAIGNIFDFDFWRNRTADAAHTIGEAIFIQGGLSVASRLNISFDVEAPYAQEYILNRANQLAGRVTETTYRAITNQLAEGVGLGEGIPELSERVRTVFSDASKNRATTIARTETLSAFNGSAQKVATIEGHAGIVAQEWIATSDDRVRDTHAEVDGQRVGINERFNVDGHAIAYPGDPTGPADEVINCRCTIAFYTADEIMGRQFEPINEEPDSDIIEKLLDAVNKIDYLMELFENKIENVYGLTQVEPGQTPPEVLL